MLVTCQNGLSVLFRLCFSRLFMVALSSFRLTGNGPAGRRRAVLDGFSLSDGQPAWRLPASCKQLFIVFNPPELILSLSSISAVSMG